VATKFGFKLRLNSSSAKTKVEK